MDNLEKYINERRLEFDSDTPSPELWKRIEKDVHSGGSGKTGGKVIELKVSFLWRAAATILFLLSAGFLWLQNGESDTAGGQYAFEQELGEIEQYYNTDFNNKIAQFSSNESYNNVAPDIDQIDQVILELKEELATVPEDRKEQVVHGIIQNYRMKIQILEKVLERQMDANQKNEKNEVYEI